MRQSLQCVGSMQMMKPSSNPPPLVAVDAPSGWHVEKGDESGAHTPCPPLLLLYDIQQLHISRYHCLAQQKFTWRAVTCSTHT